MAIPPMVTFDHIQNMNDIALKPQLLRSLISEHLPDKKHPLKGLPKLSYVVFMVKTHRLLLESLAAKENLPKVIENWKAAIDSWINHLLMLASSKMPDKCWIGICLLGVTCQECSPERFLASYSIWLHKLLLIIQQTPADSQFLKVACCASLLDMITRLRKFPRVKKEVNSVAVKVVRSVLKILNEDSSEALLEGAVRLLSTFLTSFPASISCFYDSAESAVVSKIMSGKCSRKLLEELGHCLALLPKSRGDEDSWSLMMQKILLSINMHLNDNFQGVEEESKSNEAMRLLVPPGKDPPPPLGHLAGEVSEHGTKRPEPLQISTISILMHCCCTMLTCSYPVQVKVPIQQLVALARRVLMVDGSLSQALLSCITSMQQERICSELPVLHLCSLDLLGAVLEGVFSELLPHVAEIVQILKEYFKRCVLPDLRIKVYSITRILLLSTGVGTAVYISQDVIDNAIVDLDSSAHEGGGISSSPFAKPSNDMLLPFQKKRKQASIANSLQEQPDRVDLDVGMPINPATISIKIAALEALEALLTVGGALGADSWRSSVDYLLLNVATNACKGGWENEEKRVFFSSEHVPTWADFQLAALRAVLVSLLSPARARPPTLAPSLELFRRGKQGAGGKLNEFCVRALLSLEGLIHPRVFSVLDPSCRSVFFDEFDGRSPLVYAYSGKQNAPVSSSSRGKRPVDCIVDDEDCNNDDDDDLYQSWLANDEHEIPATVSGSDGTITLKPPGTPSFPPVADSGSTRVLEGIEGELASASAATGMEQQGDEDMIKAFLLEEAATKRGDPAPAAEPAEDPAAGSSRRDALADRADPAFAAVQLDTEAASSSSMESLPDIVAADPDSD
ncbi:uncharacterized protein LOC127797577 [Diospyros lotus]|uniref:uncharacterized protein LOC127797577 n=1 Tax=Diospyros lotus TaxID=55363 RepID=UPI0022566E60|nr:uncharacterized protein LOC127797577 [Diospyros lotus]